MNRTLFFALAAISANAIAQDTISTDRPSFSDGTSIVPKGRWQIEAGYTNTKFDGSRFETFGETMFRFPVSDRFEIRLFNLTYGRATGGGTTEGWQDPAVGFKYKLVSGALHKAEWTLVGLTTVPAGSREFRQDKTQPTVKLAGYLQLDATTGVGWNLVASSLAAGDTRFGQYAVSGYVSKALNAKAAVFGELYSVMPTTKDGPDASFADAGVTYLLNKNTQVDFRVGTGFNSGRDGSWFGFGIAYRF